MTRDRDRNLKTWVKSGEPWVWMNAAAVSVSILLVVGLLLLILVRGMEQFWPSEIHEIIYQDENGSRLGITAQVRSRENVDSKRLIESGMVLGEDVHSLERILLKTANRDLNGEDFRWIFDRQILKDEKPLMMAVLERTEWGDFMGRIVGLKRNGQVVDSRDVWGDFQLMIDQAARLRKQIRDLLQGEIGSTNYQLEQLRLDERQIQLDGDAGKELRDTIETARKEAEENYRRLERQLVIFNETAKRDSVILSVNDGQEVELPLSTIIDAWKPNAMGGIDRMGHFFRKFWSFLADDPREANTEGGIYPSIFGTVLMVLLMTVVVTPFGVLAAVYLSEYARQGWLTRVVRIAVNNLAGVPSIVYGVFGLGFFVYIVGGTIDELFYSEALPSPTFGSGGLLWASLTLALLTVPVVIVATEEGLSRIPRAIREGSLALGATKAETLWRTILPMASPAIMTGLILSIARAAGEVAPLMLVGVVKLAPSLPLDGNAPFIHLERKFMHLGFHIYDVGFQSPNVEAARPLVYATALILVLVIVILNLAAIYTRNHLREKYKDLEQN